MFIEKAKIPLKRTEIVTFQFSFIFYSLILTASLFVLLFCATNSVYAQKTAAEKTEKISSGKKNISLKCTSEYKLNIAPVRNLLERIKTFKNERIKRQLSIDIYSLLWECDEQFARSSFLFLWQTLLSEIESLEIKKKNTAANTQDEIKEFNKSLGANKFLQQYLISKLQALDKSQAQKLSAILTSEEKGNTDFLSLNESLNSNNLSPQHLNQIRIVLKSNPVSRTVPILFDLKKQNASIADQLYIELLNLHRNSSTLSFNDLMLLGTYNYSSRIYIYADQDDSYAYNYLPARNVSIIDLTLKRPSADKDIIIPYLSLVSRFLLNPVSNVSEKTQRYVFGRIMLGHIYEDSPNLADIMMQALQIHFDGVPDNFKNESFYEMYRRINSSSEPDNYEKNLEAVEKTVGSDERDDAAIRLANFLYNKGQYERIEKVAGYISNIEKRNSILDVSRYTQAIKFIENGKTAEAESVLKKISNPSFRVLIGFRLIQIFENDKNNTADLTEQLIYNVINDAKKSEDEYAPLLLLTLAKTIFKKDEGAAYDLITAAVKKLNNDEKWNYPKWRVELPIPTLGKLSLGFSFRRIDGLELKDSLKFLIKESKTNLEEIILSIKNENIQSEAILLLVKHYFREADRSFAVIKNNAK